MDGTGYIWAWINNDTPTSFNMDQKRKMRSTVLYFLIAFQKSRYKKLDLIMK